MASLKTLVSCVAVLSLLLAIATVSEAREFVVGGKKKSWKLPSSPDEFNKWAEKNRFQIGDSVVLTYDGKTDSVLEVTAEDYKNCNRSDPIKSHNDGDTEIKLDRSGPFYIISGAAGHCEQGEKLVIVVLSPNHNRTPVDAFPPAPAPESSAGGYLLKAGWFVTVGAVVGAISLQY